MFSVNRDPTREDLRGFGWAMVIGFGVLGALFWVLYVCQSGWQTMWQWDGAAAQITAACLWGIGLTLGVIGLTAPAIAKPIYIAWMTVTRPIGIIMATIVLSLLYFLLLPVFAIIVRRSDPIRRRLHDGPTYWEDHKPFRPTLDTMRRMF